jgi:tetratricopeptide (TPR) repeat protein
MADYSRLLKMGMQTVDIYLGRADVYMRKGEYDRALNEDGEALKLDPSSSFAYTGRSLAYWLKGMPDAAISDVRRAIQLNPDDSEAYFHLGFYQHERKAIGEARSSFLKSRELKPDVLSTHEAVWFEALGPGYGGLLKKEAAVAKSYLATTGGAPTPQASKGRDTPPQSMLHIRSVQLTPAVVKPGDSFDLRIEYSVTDRTRKEEMLDVDLSLTIMDGPAILYTLPPVRVQTQNSQMAARVEHLTASSKKGVYTVQATMRYRGVMHAQSAELRVE